MANLENTYWNKNGKFQWMADELQAAGIEIKGARTYYRYYNDGDRPHIKGFNEPFRDPEQVLEQWMDANVLEAYAKFLRK